MIKNDKKNSDNYCQLILGTTPLLDLLEVAMLLTVGWLKELRRSGIVIVTQLKKKS